MTILKRTATVLAAVLACGGLAGPSAYAADLLPLCNTLQGTNSKYELSHGGTLPLTGAPWAMVQWAPQTADEGWFFQSFRTSIQGFRATRQPSPWMGDYGQFLVMPQKGSSDVVGGFNERASEYDQAASTFQPDYMKIRLKRDDILTELTATERCAVLRLTFPAAEKSGRFFVDPWDQSKLEILKDGRTVRGYTTKSSGGVPKGFKAYFVIKFDRDITATGTYHGKDGKDVKPGQTTAEAPTDKDHIGAYVEFATSDGKPVEVQMGTSYISYEQAERNIATEATGGFDAVRAKTAEKWESNLGRMKVEGGTEEQRKTFYTCLWRAQTFPHRLHEVDEAGKPTHFSMYTGKVERGVAYGDIGFWDVYRTDFPFWAMVFPEQLGEILNGFVQSYEESGWFPQWPSPGHRGGMIGSHIDGVYADAVVKGIKGFDVAKAYEGVRKNAFVNPPNGDVGRSGLDQYEKLGYVAGKGGYAVSRSLDFAYDDWAVAQVAKAVGKTADYDMLMKRSKSYKNLWDPSTGFFRAKDDKGKWLPFDEFGWGDPYVEGGAWQNTWAVAHDVDGMATLMGGKAKMADKLDKMMGLPPAFTPGAYGGVIHEMTEMGVQRFGQYAHSNQPVHHVLYLFTEAGQPWKTQYWTRRVCEDLYNSGPSGFAGDEDNGEMSAWFVMSSMGIYPLCPGKAEYNVTTPLFDKVTLTVPTSAGGTGKPFTVTTKNQGEQNKYIKKVTLDGKPIEAWKIPHTAVTGGGSLEMELSNMPSNAQPK